MIDEDCFFRHASFCGPSSSISHRSQCLHLCDRDTAGSPARAGIWNLLRLQSSRFFCKRLWKARLMQPEKASEAQFLQELESLHAELFVVVAYGQILSQKLLSISQAGLHQCSCEPFAPISRSGAHSTLSAERRQRDGNLDSKNGLSTRCRRCD